MTGAFDYVGSARLASSSKARSRGEAVSSILEDGDGASAHTFKKLHILSRN